MKTFKEIRQMSKQMSNNDIQELSKKTLGSYVKKASDFKNNRAKDDGYMKHGEVSYDDFRSMDHNSKHTMKKRDKGISRAVNKLTREDHEEYENDDIQELSKKTLGSYVKKAQHSMTRSSRLSGENRAKANAIDRDPDTRYSQKAQFKSLNSRVRAANYDKTAKKRKAGINKAVTKLTRD